MRFETIVKISPAATDWSVRAPNDETQNENLDIKWVPLDESWMCMLRWNWQPSYIPPCPRWEVMPCAYHKGCWESPRSGNGHWNLGDWFCGWIPQYNGVRDRSFSYPTVDRPAQLHVWGWWCFGWVGLPAWLFRFHSYPQSIWKHRGLAYLIYPSVQVSFLRSEQEHLIDGFWLDQSSKTWWVYRAVWNICWYKVWWWHCYWWWSLEKIQRPMSGEQNFLPASHFAKCYLTMTPSCTWNLIDIR